MQLFELAFGEDGEFAGDATMGEGVGAVGGDFEFEEGVGRVEVNEFGADDGVGGEDEEAVFGVGEADFGGGAEHALGFDAAEFADFDDEAAAEVSAREGAGDFVADLVIFGAADDLAVGAVADVDFADFEFVGVGVRLGVFDLGDDDEFGGDAFGFDALDFDTGEGQEIGEFLG